MPKGVSFALDSRNCGTWTMSSIPCTLFISLSWGVNVEDQAWAAPQVWLCRTERSPCTPVVTGPAGVSRAKRLSYSFPFCSQHPDKDDSCPRMFESEDPERKRNYYCLGKGHMLNSNQPCSVFFGAGPSRHSILKVLLFQGISWCFPADSVPSVSPTGGLLLPFICVYLTF